MISKNLMCDPWTFTLTIPHLHMARTKNMVPAEAVGCTALLRPQNPAAPASVTRSYKKPEVFLFQTVQDSAEQNVQQNCLFEHGWCFSENCGLPHLVCAVFLVTEFVNSVSSTKPERLLLGRHLKENQLFSRCLWTKNWMCLQVLWLIVFNRWLMYTTDFFVTHHSFLPDFSKQYFVSVKIHQNFWLCYNFPWQQPSSNLLLEVDLENKLL